MKKEKSKTRKIVGGIFKGLGALGTIALVGYVGNEVRKEYDSTVEENNRLRDFINSHDFYEPQKSSNVVANDYVPETDSDNEPKKFDPNNPVYKLSHAAMRKMGLNPDGTSISKPAIAELEDEISSDGFIVKVKEDVATGFKIYKVTDEKVSETSNKEA